MPPSPPGSEIDALLQAARPAAIRGLSPRGLEVWEQGAAALAAIGRGEAPVRAWIEAAPLVAREIGEDVLSDLSPACLGFASRTSGAVIERILATAPLAARRLGDAGLFRAWLRFLDHLLGRAPRALRPMLDHLDELLAVLTLGGLRRWADWGADAHRTDYPELDRYFALASAESRAVLTRERKGTLLVDVQRRLGLYVRALWGRDVLLVPTAGDFETRAGLRPYVEGAALHLPDALDDWQGQPALDLYRAQVAHLAAHLACLQRPFQGEGLSALQSLCIGLIEDARAEALAIARFPRLRDLWAPFHAAGGAGMAGRLDGIARALLLQAAPQDTPLECWILAEFQRSDLYLPDISRRLGLALAERLKTEQFSSFEDRLSCPYRCDNRVLWTFEALDFDNAPAHRSQTRKYVSIMEMVNEVEVETAGADAQEIWVQADELLADDGTRFSDPEGKAPLAPPIPCDEFDHRLQLMRPAWATILESRPCPGDPARAEAILARHRAVLDRLRHRLEAMRPQGTVRLRKLEDGDDLDLDAAIAAAIDTRLGRQPDPRVMMRYDRKLRDTAVLVLLDLSESTNDATAAGPTVLDLTQSACVLLAEAIHRVGDRFALHGFQSDGRHHVFYSRFKDFQAPWDSAAKARLMGAQGRLSTRMGIAIRHAARHLGRIEASRKLMIVLTDGAPADIDVTDPLYLRADARHAVEEAARQGITPFCLSLDPGADAYVQRIFGPRNALVLDRVERLPERLPQLYAALTR